MLQKLTPISDFNHAPERNDPNKVSQAPSHILADLLRIVPVLVHALRKLIRWWIIKTKNCKIKGKRKTGKREKLTKTLASETHSTSNMSLALVSANSLPEPHPA